MADKYDVPALKELAAKRFSEVLPSEGGSTSFIASLDLIYNNTPDSDRLLYGHAIQYAANHYEELVKNENFKNLCIANSLLQLEYNDRG
jgi:hypothetical protein